MNPDHLVIAFTPEALVALDGIRATAEVQLAWLMALTLGETRGNSKALPTRRANPYPAA